MMKKNKRDIVFKNRKEAAKLLLDQLPLHNMRNQNWSLIALSPGGFEVAHEVAKKMKLDVDFLFNEAIFAPGNKECEIARVSETEEIVIDNRLLNAFDIELNYIYSEAKIKYEEKIKKNMLEMR